MQEFILITGMTMITFSIRYTLFAIAGKVHFPDLLQKALIYIPPTVLTAIIIPSILIPLGGTPPDEQIQFNLDNTFLIAAIGAFVVGFWKQNLLLTILAGMGSFLLWGWIIS